MDDVFFNNPNLNKVREFLLSKNRAAAQLSHYLNNKFKFSPLYNVVFEQFGDNLNQKLHSIAFDITTNPTCVCGERLSFLTFSKGYANFCGPKCAATDPNQIQKIANARKMKYGTSILSEINMEKATRTKIERYGVEHQMKNAEIATKRSGTMASKYGGVGFASTEINQKIEDTMIERFGVRRNYHSDTLVKSYVKATLEREFNKRILEYDNFQIHRTLDEYFGQSQFHLMTCKRCGTTIERNFMHGGPKCPKCDIGAGSSIPERHLTEIVKSIVPDGTEVITGARIFENRQLSVDIYIPKFNIAFEFNGLYWHSSEFKDKWFHHDKTAQLAEKGIQLVHIFEDDFTYRKDIVISMIRQKLHQQSIKVYARKCVVTRITAKLARDFCERTHLQGFIAGTFYIGMYYEDKLVAVMTLSKSRFNNKYQWELGRWCCELNHSVIGGFSRCLKYAKQLVLGAPILTYCDAAHSDGTTYKKFGTYLYHTEPNYFYFKGGGQRESRMKFQKHKLKLSKNFDEAKTEKQIMQEDGWKLIYDCGNMVFEL